jgi:Domain of unknown function (DUF4136)
MKRLHSSFAATLLALAAALLAGCSSGPDIRADYDKQTDFSAYKTYNFFSDAGPSRGNYQGLFTQYMKAAIDREMQSRGYVKSDDPDLLVNFNANMEDKTKVTTSPSMGGYYGYRGGYYGPWAGYGYGTETHVSQYTEGTLNIDLVDADRMQLVWEGVGVGRITEDKLKNIEREVDAAVPLFFEQFPFVAGSNSPAPTE